ncbi:MAG: ABC transporter ATP-binding protein [Acidimicrobiia bacterium]|nr:ABC transporter ATP-binding protein [Acidimicrobiia bacterium]
MSRSAIGDPVVAIEDISFGVGRGEVVGLVGPNGAGKTTLLRIIATLLEPTTGRVTLDDVDMNDDPVRARAQLGLLLTDERSLYWRLTGRQNLEFFGAMAGLDRGSARRRAEELLDELELSHRDKRVFGYSSGMRVRLGLARALLHDPPLLVLDEPSRSLDPLYSVELGARLRQLAGAGRAILLSSHRLDEVADWCDRVVVLVDGSTRFDGRTTDLSSESAAIPRALHDLLVPGSDDRE